MLLATHFYGPCCSRTSGSGGVEAVSRPPSSWKPTGCVDGTDLATIVAATAWQGAGGLESVKLNVYPVLIASMRAALGLAVVAALPVATAIYCRVGYGQRVWLGPDGEQVVIDTTWIRSCPTSTACFEATTQSADSMTALIGGEWCVANTVAATGLE